MDKMQSESVPGEVQAALAEIVSPDAVPADPPVVQPPAYGRWPAQTMHVDPQTGGWIGDLNLSPTRRVVARLGGDVVRTQQEELVAEARRQAGAYQAARRARDYLALGELTAARLVTRRFTDVSSARMVALARPAHTAIPFDDTTNVSSRLESSTVDRAILSPALARVSVQAGRQLGVAERTVRTGLMTGTFARTFQAPDVAIPAQSVDFGRVREVYARANILDRVVGGATIGQLIELAPAAIAAQTALIEQLADVHVDVIAHPPEPDPHDGIDVIDPGGIEVIHHGGIDVIDPGGIDVIGHGGIEAIHHGGVIDVNPDHINLSAAHFAVRDFQGIALNETVAEGVAEEVLALNRDFAARSALRLSDADKTQLSSVVFESLQPAIAVLGHETAAQPIAVEQFILDSTTASLGKVFRETVGGAATELQIGVRAAVRAQLGLVTMTPIQRDQLTVDVQARFDGAVTAVTNRALLSSLVYPPAPDLISVESVAQACTTGLAAATTYTKAIAASLLLKGEAVVKRPAEVVLGFVPQFTSPLAARLERSLNSWILAGASTLPANAITLVVTNPSFIEAFCIGANHEVAGELLWRDVPSDPRGTVFTRFWANAPIAPIHTWQNGIGGNVDNGNPLIAVVLRSPLLRRYPNTIIYAAKELVTDGDPSFTPDPDTIAHVLYQGFIEPDATFSVIDLKADDARDPDQRWYILISQPVTDPRFGLDEWTGEGAPSAPRDWNDLTWTHIPNQRLSPALPVPTPTVADPAGATWATSAADLAYILHQDPFRIVLPAADYLPKPQ
jgi:hypothetical protein